MAANYKELLSSVYTVWEGIDELTGMFFSGVSGLSECHEDNDELKKVWRLIFGHGDYNGLVNEYEDAYMSWPKPVNKGTRIDRVRNYNLRLDQSYERLQDMIETMHYLSNTVVLDIVGDYDWHESINSAITILVDSLHERLCRPDNETIFRVKRKYKKLMNELGVA